MAQYFLHTGVTLLVGKSMWEDKKPVQS